MHTLRLLPLFGLLTFGSSVTANAEANEKPPQPNIILIMADDLGVEGLGCYGGLSYRTPHLDRLAKQGLRFRHAYAQPLCTNTRIQLLTGQSNNRNWLSFGILDPRERTFGHDLSEAGYQTCIAGKWQLRSYDPPDYPGADLRRNTGMRVEHAGFDHYCLWHTGHTEDKGSRYADPKIIQDGNLREQTVGEYGPDLWVDDINNFVTRASRRDKPFFVYYPMALPHRPMVPTPTSADWADPAKRFEEKTAHFGEMVEYLDECVGRIVANADRLGLGESTLILFYSDNGTHQSIVSKTENGPVRGGKGLTTDAGTHVPLIARWTGTITPGISDALIDSTDFVPTLLEAAGGTVPKSRSLDGVSFFPVLTGKQTTSERQWIFCHYDPRPGWDKDQFGHIRFARDRRFKLYDDGRFYDVPGDPLEQHPLDLKDLSDKATKAHRTLAAVLEKMPDPETPARDPLPFKPTAQTEIVPEDAELERVWDRGVFTEGPVALPDGALLFSDVRPGRIYRLDPKTDAVTVFREKSGASNGLNLDKQNRLIAAEGADGGNRRISITDPDGTVRTLADSWNGKRFNSPNDLTVAPDGTVYFTDPRYRGDERREIDFEGVFGIRPDGEVFLATRNVEKPNGILISHDGKHAYVADNNNANGGARKLYRFNLDETGKFRNREMLFDFGRGRRGIDGMTLDVSGRIYATAGRGKNSGVYVFSPTGKHLAKISVPGTPTNCTFGRFDTATTLFITAETPTDGTPGTTFGLYRIRLNPTGRPMPQER